MAGADHAGERCRERAIGQWLRSARGNAVDGVAPHAGGVGAARRRSSDAGRGKAGDADAFA